MKYCVYLEQDEDGMFVATCPVLPGCISRGRTRVEATENIREAIEGYVKSLRKPASRSHPVFEKRSSKSPRSELARRVGPLRQSRPYASSVTSLTISTAAI